VTGIFDPVDPVKAGTAFMKERVALVFTAMELGVVPDLPVAPGWFRCFACRREFEKDQTGPEARDEYRRRFGEELDDADAYAVCNDCNRIIAEDLGLPL
jgi:DNA-directed RNA polymerase subunit RPC12/RpoP